MDQLRGIVEHITYSSEEQGFSVLKIRCKLLILVGEKKAVAYSVKNNVSSKRNTLLVERLLN